MKDGEMQKSKTYPQVLAALSASLAMISAGYHIGWPNPSLPKLLAEDSDIPVTSSQGSWIVSFQWMGSICGALLGSVIVDRWGRKTVVLLMSIPLCGACLMTALANTYWWLYIARFMAGLGLGTIQMSVPMYMSEIGEKRMRGGFGILIFVMMSAGFIMSFSLGPWVSRATFAAYGALVPVIQIIAFAWVPESPFYYAIKNQPYKIEKSLRWLRGTPDVAEEVTQVQKTVTNNKNHAGPAIKLLTDRGSRKALIISLGLVTSHHFSGMSAILVYSTVILNRIDSGINSSIFIIMMGVLQLIIGIGIVFVTDRAGRRPLLISSMSSCAVCLLGVAVYFQLQANGTDVSRISWVPLAALVGHLIGFSLGVGPLPIAVSAEIFPCDVKAVGMTAITVYFSLAGIWVTKLYQILTDAFSIHVSFYTLAASGTLCLIFIIFVVPETKNRSLSEIQNELRGLPEPIFTEKDVRKELIKC